MTVTMEHLRSLTTGAASGPKALLMLFESREFYADPGRRLSVAQAICNLMDEYLTLKSREVIELALAAEKATDKAAIIVGGRGQMSEQIATTVALFTTDASSVPMLGFSRDMLAPFGTTNGLVGGRIRDAWWMAMTKNSLSISGRTIWDREN